MSCADTHLGFLRRNPHPHPHYIEGVHFVTAPSATCAVKDTFNTWLHSLSVSQLQLHMSASCFLCMLACARPTATTTQSWPTSSLWQTFPAVQDWECCSHCVFGCFCSIAADLSCCGVSTVVVVTHTQMGQTLPVMCRLQTSSCWTPMEMAALPWLTTRMRRITP